MATTDEAEPETGSLQPSASLEAPSPVEAALVNISSNVGREQAEPETVSLQPSASLEAPPDAKGDPLTISSNLESDQAEPETVSLQPSASLEAPPDAKGDPLTISSNLESDQVDTETASLQPSTALEAPPLTTSNIADSEQAQRVEITDAEYSSTVGDGNEDKSLAPLPPFRIEDTMDEGLISELREAFILAMHPGDRNSIDSRKLLSVLRSLGIAISPSEHAELVSAADPSGSGQISWQVFLALGSTLAAGRKDPKFEEADLLEAFRKVDKAGAGTINVCDFRKAATQVEQEEADRSALWKVIKDEEVNGQVNYEDFVRRHVTERRWHESYLGPGGLLTAPS